MPRGRKDPQHYASLFDPVGYELGYIFERMYMRNGSSVRFKGAIRCDSCSNYFSSLGIGSHMRRHGKSYKFVKKNGSAMSPAEAGRLGGLARSKSAKGSLVDLDANSSTLARTLAAKVKRYRAQADKYILLGNTFEAALAALNTGV